MFGFRKVRHPADADQPSDICPRCLYPMTGLPRGTNCPECGLLRDEESQSWRLTVETPRTLPFWQLMCLYALLPLWMLFQGYGMAVRLVSGVIVVAIFGGAIAYQTRALRRDREIGVVMAVTPEGLWRIHGAGTARAPIPWSGITQIDFGLYDFRSRIRLTSGKVEYLPMGFKDQASYNAFVAACRHYGERAGLTFGHRGD